MAKKREYKNWKNLLKNYCPKCGSSLKNNVCGKECSNQRCDFFITKEKFSDLTLTMLQEINKKQL